eukprot:766364-Hanusia_phi.AAC.4
MSESGLYIAHPCTRHFGPVKAEPCAGGEDKLNGLKFDDALVKAMKESGRGVELTTPVCFVSWATLPHSDPVLLVPVLLPRLSCVARVMEFLSGIQRPDDKQTLVKIKVTSLPASAGLLCGDRAQVVKRRLLPEWVKQEYGSQWKCGVVQSADHGQREAVKKRTMGELANAASNGSMKRLKAET